MTTLYCPFRHSLEVMKRGEGVAATDCSSPYALFLMFALLVYSDMSCLCCLFLWCILLTLLVSCEIAGLPPCLLVVIYLIYRACFLCYILFDLLCLFLMIYFIYLSSPLSYILYTLLHLSWLFYFSTLITLMLLLGSQGAQSRERSSKSSRLDGGIPSRGTPRAIEDY